MSPYKKKENCSGCSACKNICPQKAIEMLPDKEGFFYPIIDKKKCVHCGWCEKVCSFDDMSKVTLSDKPLNVWAIKHKNDKVRAISQSGGMAFAAACKTIECGGVVFGAGFNSALEVCHKKYEKIEELSDFCGSKYVQSNVGNVFEFVQKALSSAKNVLFTGTPCQISGLKSFLKTNELSRLVCLELICHGVPTPKSFKDYLLYCESEFNGRIKKFDFRAKHVGWGPHVEEFVIDSKTYRKNVYANLFYSHLLLRPCCYICPFATLQRCADITIGDFWGIENCMPDFKDSKGVSVVMINTEKGKAFFESMTSVLEKIEITSDDYIQPNLERPTPEPDNRQQFWENYYEYGFPYIAKHYGGDSVLYLFKRFTKKCLERLGLLESIHYFLKK